MTSIDFIADSVRGIVLPVVVIAVIAASCPARVGTSCSRWLSS
jgi:hypothetical protein